MSEYLENITEGFVSFEDGVKAAEEYAPAKKVRVELRFQVFEGQTHDDVDQLVTLVGDRARTEVGRLLGTTASVSAGAATAADTTAGAATTTRKRRTRAEIEADEAASRAAAGGGSGGAADALADLTGDGASTAQDAKGNPVVDDALDFSTEIPATPPADETFDIAAEPATEVTDADLNAACQETNGRISDPGAIRGVIASYNPDPTKTFQVAQIPQDKRAEFVAKLKALQPKA